MMNIAVCFKVLSDYQRLFSGTPEFNEQYQLDTSYIRQLFNCFDESALEMALQLKDTLKKEDRPVTLSAMTVDNQRADLFLKHLAAVGYDDLVRIECDATMDLRFNSLAVSGLLTALLKRNIPDLVLCGTQGADGDNRQTGFLVAERLQWPCISQVEQIEWTGTSRRLKVFSRTDSNTLVQIITLPVVLIVGQSQEAPYLRFPSLNQKLEAGKRTPTLLSPKDLGVDDTALLPDDKTLIRLESYASNHDCTFLNSDGLEALPPKEQARQLFDRYLRERLFP